jgi:stage II sporulation protein D
VGGYLRKIFKLILVGVIFLLLFFPASGKETPELRICLDQNATSVSYRIQSGHYELRDFTTNWLIGELKPGDVVMVNLVGSSLNVEVNSKQDNIPYSGPLIALPSDKSDKNVFSFQNRQYRDGITISIDNRRLLTVNHVGIEHYLYGVVGREMGNDAPEEALKAQAVASRSYALALQGSGLKYDLGVNTSTQVYGGYSAEMDFGAERAIQAVDETRGEVIYYKDNGNKKIVQAFFHSNAGGYTEDSENVWNESLPYLRGVPSPDDDYAEKYGEMIGQKWASESYRWEKTFSLAEIEEAIKKYNEGSSSPINIGGFQEIILHREGRDAKSKTVSGRVTRVELVGTKGKANVYRDNIRTLFGLKSTKFDVIGSTSKIIVIENGLGERRRLEETTGLKIIGAGDYLVDSNDINEPFQAITHNGKTVLTGRSEKITFKGFGYGHGIGMSQWGAQGMAVKGASYREIIEHYYNQDKKDGKLTVESY